MKKYLITVRGTDPYVASVPGLRVRASCTHSIDVAVRRCAEKLGTVKAIRRLVAQTYEVEISK